MLSLAQNYYWPICFASFEKLTHQHFGNLAEKVWDKPFTRREGLPKDVSVMTEKEVLPCCQAYVLVCAHCAHVWPRGCVCRWRAR